MAGSDRDQRVAPTGAGFPRWGGSDPLVANSEAGSITAGGPLPPSWCERLLAETVAKNDVADCFAGKGQDGPETAGMGEIIAFSRVGGVGFGLANSAAQLVVAAGGQRRAAIDGLPADLEAASARCRFVR